MFNCFIELAIEAKNWPSGRNSEETTGKKPETEENVHIYNSYYKNSYKFQLEIELFESLFLAFSIFQFKFDYGFFTAQADKTPSPIIFVLFCMHVQFFCLQSIEWIQYESTEISNCSFFFFKCSSLWKL